ncbi:MULTISPECIES: phosphoribosylaminoimidazolesuccinocarboxamide synthase [unclassified Aureispira]|uniref:phosphoribosylaminoimidazolesuccinocarboxamide synthase n=1 Tax=unclassified Aureispira TaxID=2649989 RepID=UPI0007C6D39A|nr:MULTISPECIES: phosphoribosylaminoimidazolesuccinocarboxamide synthase [unclassified Aureispira]WMX15446.1 phosphoribosylaminoimidazolesuccinocarboxamide synthase [Aureispira sp. CCB-E]
MDCLTKFDSPQLKTLHRGKVRDSIRIDDNTRMIVVTDRISAFNKKIKTAIPTKGAVLNGIANFWFEQTKHIIDNHVIEQVDDYVTLVKEAEPIRVEMVVRGYLTGSMWRGYENGKRQISDVVVPDGMVKNQKFDQPILTPTTKDDDDSEINEQGILEAGLVSAEIYQQMKAKAIELFTFGSEFLAERGIVLVDTKYEFGLLDGKLILIDEMHTPDSSRFWSLEDYQANPSTAEQIDKEFVRQWMLANQVNGEVPTILSPEVVAETSRRYQEIYKAVTGKPFSLVDLPSKVRIYNNLVKAGVLKPGFIGIIMDDEEDLDDCKVLKDLVEEYDLCVDMRVISADRNGERILDLAAVYNTSVEPVAVIAVGPDSLGMALVANLSVPVIDGVGASMDSVVRATVSSLNIPSIREQMAQEIVEMKQSLADADAVIRN